MSRTTLTPKPCGLLSMETIEDSSVRYFPLSQTVGNKYVSLFSMSRTIADSLGRYYLLYRTVRDKYVFHFFMSNQLSDRSPCRGVLHTPHIDSTSTHSPFAGRLVGRMQYAPTLSEKERFPRVGITYCLGQRWINTYFISSCLIGCQIGTHVGRIEYAPYRFNVYPFAPCGAFGRAYAIRPYISGKRQGFLGYVFSIVSDNGG